MDFIMEMLCEIDFCHFFHGTRKISSNPTQEQENKPPQFKYIHSDVNVPTQFWPSNDWIKKTMLWFSCTRSFFGTANNSNFSYAKAMILIDKQEFPNINEIGCFEETEQILLYFSNQTKQFSKSDLAWIFYCLIFH